MDGLEYSYNVNIVSQRLRNSEMIDTSYGNGDRCIKLLFPNRLVLDFYEIISSINPNTIPQRIDSRWPA